MTMNCLLVSLDKVLLTKYLSIDLWQVLANLTSVQSYFDIFSKKLDQEIMVRWDDIFRSVCYFLTA